jgi:hypothetical protein
MLKSIESIEYIDKDTYIQPDIITYQ